MPNLDLNTVLNKIGEDVTLMFAIEAEFLIEMGYPDEAIYLCVDGLKSFPKYVSGYTVLAKSYIVLGRLEEAMKTMDEAVQLFPKNKSLINFSRNELGIEYDEFKTSNTRKVLERGDDFIFDYSSKTFRDNNKELFVKEKNVENEKIDLEDLSNEDGIEDTYNDYEESKYEESNYDGEDLFNLDSKEFQNGENSLNTENYNISELENDYKLVVNQEELNNQMSDFDFDSEKRNLVTSDFDTTNPNLIEGVNLNNSNLLDEVLEVLDNTERAKDNSLNDFIKENLFDVELDLKYNNITKDTQIELEESKFEDSISEESNQEELLENSNTNEIEEDEIDEVDIDEDENNLAEFNEVKFNDVANKDFEISDELDELSDLFNIDKEFDDFKEVETFENIKNIYENDLIDNALKNELDDFVSSTNTKNDEFQDLLKDVNFIDIEPYIAEKELQENKINNLTDEINEIDELIKNVNHTVENSKDYDSSTEDLAQQIAEIDNIVLEEDTEDITEDYNNDEIVDDIDGDKDKEAADLDKLDDIINSSKLENLDILDNLINNEQSDIREETQEIEVTEKKKPIDILSEVNQKLASAEYTWEEVERLLNENAKKISDTNTEQQNKNAINEDDKNLENDEKNINNKENTYLPISETLAKIYLSQNEYEEAIKVYQKLKTLESDKSSIYEKEIKKIKKIIKNLEKK